jgi:hypothetical protein
MADDYMKKYEDEYESLYGTGNNDNLNYDHVTGTYTQP